MSAPARPDTEARLRAAIPEAVRGLVATLRAGGFEAWLVGGCVRDLLRGAPVQDFDLATSAPPEAVLARFPRAVAIGLAHGTVMIPTSAGPVDVTRYRAGDALESDLAHRDFTVNAIALDPETGAVRDPFSGRSDLAAGRLRAVGSAAERLAEDPLRALRAARLVATLGLEVDPTLEAALREVTGILTRVARERIRQELQALLCGAHVAGGLALLRRTGLEAQLAPGVGADAAAVVAALPAHDLGLRMAAWLRTARGPAATLAKLRVSRRLVQRVQRLLRLHPVEAAADPDSDVSVRRLLQRCGDEPLESWIALRRAEIASGSADAGASARLDALVAAAERVRAAGALALHRLDLALDGGAVMEALGAGPGPHVGAALRHLTERVLEDPGLNTPEMLRALLAEWRQEPAEPGRKR